MLNKTHKVVSGDTLFSLAKKYGLTVSELKAINHLTTDIIKTGQILKLTQFTHIVASGDTLFSLAKTYKTTVDKIKSLNQLKNNTIKIGQILNLPEIYDAEFEFINQKDGTPLVNTYYSIELCNGTKHTGCTDEKGMTQPIVSDYCAKVISITLDEDIDLSLDTRNMLANSNSGYKVDFYDTVIELTKSVHRLAKPHNKKDKVGIRVLSKSILYQKPTEEEIKIAMTKMIADVFGANAFPERNKPEYIDKEVMEVLNSALKELRECTRDLVKIEPIFSFLYTIPNFFVLTEFTISIGISASATAYADWKYSGNILDTYIGWTKLLAGDKEYHTCLVKVRANWHTEMYRALIGGI